MKNIHKLIILLVTVVTVFSSCEKDTTEDVSKVTYFPEFDYEKQVVLALGDPFEAEVKATENGKEITIVIGGDTVDTSKVGIYQISYSATNTDGIEAHVDQTVIVHDPSIVGTDVSGKIQDTNRTSRTAEISLVTGTTSVFYVTDFAFGAVFPMYFQMDGDTISEIPQDYIFGVESVDLGYDSATKIFTTKVNPQGFSYSFKYQ